MTCEKMWLVSENGRPVPLQKSEDGIHREPVTVKMVFAPQRHVLDLAKQATIEPIAPYHFKGKPLLILLLGVTVGIVVAGLMDIEPVISAIVVLTFALTTLIFQSGAASEYRLVKTSGPQGTRCIVVSEEDLDDLKAAYPQTFLEEEAPAPLILTESERAQVEILRYGFVTTCGALTLFALSRPLRRVFEGDADLVTTVATPVVFCAAAAIAYTGVAKIIISTIKRIRHRPTDRNE